MGRVKDMIIGESDRIKELLIEPIWMSDIELMTFIMENCDKGAESHIFDILDSERTMEKGRITIGLKDGK